MPTELYRDDAHSCIVFDDLVQGDGIQANQFLIVDHGHAALLDPGGDLTYTGLSVAVGRHIRIKELDYVLASHQDPDIIASLDKWLLYTNCSVGISKLWERFLPHLVPAYMGSAGSDRILPIADKGMDIPLGEGVIRALPAHFLHSVGNLSFYDPESRILFSGDIGASSLPPAKGEDETASFEPRAADMLSFHQRYMSSNKACRLWVNMVRSLDVDVIAPQHGPPMRGEETIQRFLSWLEQLECGIDRLTQQDFNAA